MRRAKKSAGASVRAMISVLYKKINGFVKRAKNARKKDSREKLSTSRASTAASANVCTRGFWKNNGTDFWSNFTGFMVFPILSFYADPQKKPKNSKVFPGLSGIQKSTTARQNEKRRKNKFRVNIIAENGKYASKKLLKYKEKKGSCGGIIAAWPGKKRKCKGSA